MNSDLAARLDLESCLDYCRRRLGTGAVPNRWRSTEAVARDVAAGRTTLSWVRRADGVVLYGREVDTSGTEHCTASY